MFLGKHNYNLCHTQSLSQSLFIRFCYSLSIYLNLFPLSPTHGRFEIYTSFHLHPSFYGLPAISLVVVETGFLRRVWLLSDSDYHLFNKNMNKVSPFAIMFLTFRFVVATTGYRQLVWWW